MKILSIETSCDETGISVVEGDGSTTGSIKLLGNALASQIELHRKYGGVFPAMAKRAHAEKIVSLLIEALAQAQLLDIHHVTLLPEEKEIIRALCVKEEALVEPFFSFFSTYKKPVIDHIAVTTGPGLEPALWVGINAAKVLSVIWNIPLIPINHMEGHVLVTLLQKIPAKPQQEFMLGTIAFPALALLVSGGHTELVLVHSYSEYEKIGATRDDAVGEAFDKVARMLELPYPGGPAISKLAEAHRATGEASTITLPRPMIASRDYDFSFSGIKTAVLYLLRDLHKENPNVLQDENIKSAVAREFENAVVEVLVAKTMRAIEEYSIQTLIVGGGVAGNTYLQSELLRVIKKNIPIPTLLFPDAWLATDNSVMIGIAAYVRLVYGNSETLHHTAMKADGNLSITDGGFRK